MTLGKCKIIDGKRRCETYTDCVAAGVCLHPNLNELICPDCDVYCNDEGYCNECGYDVLNDLAIALDDYPHPYARPRTIYQSSRNLQDAYDELAAAVWDEWKTLFRIPINNLRKLINKLKGKNHERD